MCIVRAQVGQHLVRVFTYEGKPVKQLSTKAWYKALARAGIESFRWHGLRHTWASWHVQNGTPLFALQELAGWETEKTRRWCGAMRTVLRVTSRCMPTTWKVMAQLRHDRRISAAQEAQLVECQKGPWLRPGATTGFFVRVSSAAASC